LYLSRKYLGPCESQNPRQASLPSLDDKLKGRTQCHRLPALHGVWGRVVLSDKPFPHKYAETGARIRDLSVTGGRLNRCTRPALLVLISNFIFSSSLNDTLTYRKMAKKMEHLGYEAKAYSYRREIY